MVDQGYITSLNVISSGSTATLGVSTVTGYIRKIFLNKDGFDYDKVPTVSITTAPAGGTDATAVAITTSVNGCILSQRNITYQSRFWIYCCTNSYNCKCSIYNRRSRINNFGVGAAATCFTCY